MSGTLETNEVYQLLLGAGLDLRQESVSSPGPGREPTVTLFVVTGAAHFAIRQYTTAEAVAAAGFTPGSAVAMGDAPFEFWATNIVLDIGPTDARALPKAPDAVVASAALSIVAALDPYIGPFQQRAVNPIVLPSSPAPPSPSASPTRSGQPARTPKPSPSPGRS